MDTFKFSNSKRVYFDNGVSKGFGKIVGIAHADLPIVGVGYMVKTDHKLWEYDCIVVYEIYLKEE